MAPSLGFEVTPVNVHDAGEIERAVGVRPLWWTASGGRFDRLLGVAILILRGA
jgi:hypothetical protein